MNSTHIVAGKSHSYSTTSVPFTPSSPGALKQRLVVCLDGTWNKRDDCTNVYHIHNLIVEGVVNSAGEQVHQRRYYDQGVGTGVLDNISGGAFGFGLEENVREAYDWLVENYQDGDEIYVFGFSRGAYTARSLVGFIGRCGLLMRGAPLSVNQLWNGYGLLGRKNEDRSNWWEALAGHPTPPFEQITNLKFDPWNGGGVRKKDPNPTEQLILQWSRRTMIRFVGIFDTVGAMGWDALAIPGLRSKLALHHNMRATKLVQSCRHALAIDEHRTSFSHTPIIEYIDNSWSVEEEQKERVDWIRRIQQRWFVGAHANIGGGYEDNVLSLGPLEWVLTGAENCGLVTQMLPMPSVHPQAKRRRDSFLQFAAPVWAHVFRAKRNFRRIEPPHEVHGPGARVEKNSNLPPTAGYSLRCINEDVDASAFVMANSDKEYQPPNLIEYVARSHVNSGPLASARPQHPWLAAEWRGRAALIMWSVFGSLGLVVWSRIFCVPPDAALPIWFVPAVCAALVLIDWSESRVNFALALHPDLPRRQGFLDSIFWLRGAGLFLVVPGAVAFLVNFAINGWSATDVSTCLLDARNAFSKVWLLPVVATLATLIADAGDRKLRFVSAIAGVFAGSASVMFVGVVTALAGYWIGQCAWHWSRGEINPMLSVPSLAGDGPPVAGHLLLLQLALLCLAQSLKRVAEPMLKAHLGSVIALQLAWSPDRVRQKLDEWRAKLTCAWEPDGQQSRLAADRVRYTVGKALWRDALGFVPLYSVVLAFGMWMLVSDYRWPWLDWLRDTRFGLPLWLWISVVTALANWVENAAHVGYLRRFALEGKPSWFAVMAGAFVTCVKFCGFSASCIASIAVLISASWEVINSLEPLTWRGAIAGTASLVVAHAVLLALIGAAVSRLRQKAA